MNKIKIAKKQTLDGILFLQGVFKKDCKRVEDFFHERLLHDGSTENKMYDKIPLVFTGIDTWIKNTNLLCWVCSRAFKTMPWFEPQSIDPLCSGRIGVFLDSQQIKTNEKNKKFCINIKGNFCSPNCVMRNILTNTKDLSERHNKISMLKFVYELFTGIKIYNIEPSPIHTDMIQYGGFMTMHEYQKKIEEISNNYLKVEDENFVNNAKQHIDKLLSD
jgi:hypothetical protein